VGAAGGAGNLNRLYGGSAGGAQARRRHSFWTWLDAGGLARALAASGGLEPLVDSLADDYEMGARIAQAGYRVELCGEVVETAVPAYGFHGFCEHQIRWARTTRDSRRWGYLGLGITYCIPWAVLNCVASGFALWSFTLLSLVVLARVAVALTVGVGLLGDAQVLRDIWLLPAARLLRPRLLGVELRLRHNRLARRALPPHNGPNFSSERRKGLTPDLHRQAPIQMK